MPKNAGFIGTVEIPERFRYNESESVISRN